MNANPGKKTLSENRQVKRQTIINHTKLAAVHSSESNNLLSASLFKIKQCNITNKKTNTTVQALHNFIKKCTPTYEH